VRPHNITRVIRELEGLHAGLNVPEEAGHVARAGDDLTVGEEAAAGKVAGVGAELPRDPHRPLLGLEVVDRADVVEAPAGDKVARGSIGAGHDPGGAEGDGVDLVGGDGVPHDQLPVLRGAHQVPLVLCPVHRVHLGQMPLERPSHLH